MDKSKAILYLSSLGLYSNEITYILDKYENPIEIIKSDSLDKNISIERSVKKKYLKNRNDFDSYQEFMHKNKISYITICDDNYPNSLKIIESPPAILYIKGELDLTRFGISVVGARKCTEYGKWSCKHLIEELSSYGLSIISGLALGIDRISHETALDNNMYTIGVLGCGVDRIYPYRNKYLFEQMEEKGAIISEFPLGSEPMAHHFPIRNRIISALGLGLLVIEAKVKSGTLITAGYAADQGKEVFAVPGNINSQFSKGTNCLIKDGAKLVMSVEDIIEELPEVKLLKEETLKIKRDISKLNREEMRIYEIVCSNPLSVDELAKEVNMPISQLMSTITLLELKGILVELDGKWNIN